MTASLNMIYLLIDKSIFNVIEMKCPFQFLSDVPRSRVDSPITKSWEKEQQIYHLCDVSKSVFFNAVPGVHIFFIPQTLWIHYFWCQMHWRDNVHMCLHLVQKTPDENIRHIDYLKRIIRSMHYLRISLLFSTSMWKKTVHKCV